MARERVVSAAAFAASAALFGVIGLLLTSRFDDLVQDILGSSLLSPLLLALPAAVAGWLAGPRLARATDSLEAAIVGMAVTLGAVLLYVAAGGAFLCIADVLNGAAVSTVLRQAARAVVWLVGYSFLAGLVASPFGALGATVAWRQIRRSVPTEPV